MENVERELTPKNDIIFKRLFGKKGNEEIVKDFLEAVLDIKIESVEIEADNECKLYNKTEQKFSSKIE